MTSQLIIDRLISRMGELPPMPQVAQKALSLIRDPQSNMSELARVLALDEAMTSLVLRWVNSAYYGLKYPVPTVQQAVALLGQKTVHGLILAASMASLLDQPAPGYGLDRGELWRHSIGTAAGARIIASQFSKQAGDEAYHAGLLCDIGKLAFEVLLRGIDINIPEWQGRPFEELEVLHFGVDHATLGAEIARRWGLPANLVTAIAYHHNPAVVKENTQLVDAVHLANAAMMMLGVGIGRDGLQYRIDPIAVARMRWDDANFNDILERVIPFIDEADNFIRLRRN